MNFDGGGDKKFLQQLLRNSLQNLHNFAFFDDSIHNKMQITQ